jgi:hypothetical protein
VISFPVTLTSTEGATPASSDSSSALSDSSLTTTLGQYSTSWPVSLISSLLEANSASREVRKVLRVRLGSPRPVAATAITPSLSAQAYGGVRACGAAGSVRSASIRSAARANGGHDGQTAA